MSKTIHPTQAAQLESVDQTERVLQLLCVIAQTLHRIEARLTKPTTEQPGENNRILVFKTGGRP